MYLLIDIGNSTIVVAVADKEGNIANTWRFKTRKEETVSFFRNELLAGLNRMHLAFSEVEKVVVSSVVPEVNDDISHAIVELTGMAPHFFTTADAQKVIGIDIDSPNQLGKDRLADAVGACACHGYPAIVFDLGTATTVGIVNEDRCFVGGMIIPGVKTSLNALSTRASQLPAISIEKPQNMIGRNTLECMQSGILYGTASMIDGLIERIAPMFSKPVTIVATGGMAKTVIPFCKHKIIRDDYLQFKGLFHCVTHP